MSNLRKRSGRKINVLRALGAEHSDGLDPFSPAFGTWISSVGAEGDTLRIADLVEGRRMLERELEDEARIAAERESYVHTRQILMDEFLSSVGSNTMYTGMDTS